MVNSIYRRRRPETHSSSRRRLSPACPFYYQIIFGSKGGSAKIAAEAQKNTTKNESACEALTVG
jgi:hypothetical protein